MGLVGALLAVKVDARIARVIRRRLVVRRRVLPLEALEARPRVDERAVDAELIATDQPGPLRRLDHGAKELPGRVARHEPIPILREDRRIEARLLHIHIEEPAKHEVVVELLAELPLAAHRVQRDEQHRFEQPLGRDRGSPHRRVHLVEHGRQLRERCVRQLLDPPKRVRRWHPRLR